MVRKHFQTQAKQKINNGNLIKTGLRYYVRYMDQYDLKRSKDLQDHVIKTLQTIGKTHFIIPKKTSYLRQLLNKGNAIVGTFVRDPDPNKEDRLASHMAIIYPQAKSETGLAKESALPDKNLDNISVVSNILVHQDFRGNRLMQQMLDEWLKIATADGKRHAIAEVCTDNPFSWNVFLDCGFVIYDESRDARDNSDLVYVHKPLDREFIYSSDPKDVTMVRLFDTQGDLDQSAYTQVKSFLHQGYHALDYDRNTRYMLLAKCVGTVPLPTVKQGPANPSPQPPGNDNKGPT